jgi:hypothetical protein
LKQNTATLGRRKKIKDLDSFGVIDIETMNWTKFIVLGAYDGSVYCEFRDVSKFFRWLNAGNGESTYFAHFGGKFDFLFLLENALKSKSVKVLGIIPRGSSILSLDVQCGSRKITFRDSSALLPFGLKTLTTEFDVKTKKGDWDHEKTKGYSKGLSEYLESDCKGLWEVLQLFYSQDLMSDAQPAFTIASQSVEVFRATLDKTHLESLTGSGESFVRPSYLGGRTEIFRPVYNGSTARPLYEYDVNSLYPFILREKEFPCGRPFFTKRFYPKLLGIYEAKVTAPPGIFIPVLGLIRNGKFVFPVGTFTSRWTSEELTLAKSRGYKFEIIQGLVFPGKKRYFGPFIERLFNIRLASKKGSVSDITAKLIMNSLYGRLGLNPEKEAITFELKSGVKPFARLKHGKNHIELFSEPIILKSFRNVALASFVTSYARTHLYRLMETVQDTLYYCDTDSIFTTTPMPTSTELGALKLEAKHTNAVFLLPKTYSLEGLKRKIRMKGFEKKKTENFSHEDFKNFFDGTLKQLKADSPPKFATFKTALRQGKLVAMTKHSTKEIRARYDKRRIVFVDENITTVPIELEE